MANSGPLPERILDVRAHESKRLSLLSFPTERELLRPIFGSDYHATIRLVSPYAGVLVRNMVSWAGSASLSVGKRCHRPV